MTVYSRTAQFETLLPLSVTHSCLLNFIELRRLPSREALYRATLQRGQRPNISVTPTVWTFVSEKKVPSATCLHNSHSSLAVTQHLRIISCAKKKEEGSREWSQVSPAQVSFALILGLVEPQSAHHNHPHNSCVQVSTFLCALWTEHHCGTAGVQASLFLFSVRVCDLLEWMPAAPLHTCPHLHASARLVCRWASVLGDTQCSASASSQALCADFCRRSPFRHVAGEIQSFSYMVGRFSFWRLRFSTEQQHA